LLMLSGRCCCRWWWCQDRLNQLLADKLEASGWKEKIKERCKTYVAKEGREQRDYTTGVKAVRPAHGQNHQACPLLPPCTHHLTRMPHLPAPLLLTLPILRCARVHLQGCKVDTAHRNTDTGVE
jgi:hypothetical protein